MTSMVIIPDNISIFSNNADEHAIHLQQAFEWLQACELYAKQSKCAFFQDNVTFLGFHISKDDISMDHDHVKAIYEWEVPQSFTVLHCQRPRQRRSERCPLIQYGHAVNAINSNGVEVVPQNPRSLTIVQYRVSVMVKGVVPIDDIEYTFAGTLFGSVRATSAYEGLGLVFAESLRAAFVEMTSS